MWWQGAFFNGLQASLLGLSHIMIQFPLYEALKRDLVAQPAPTAAVGSAGGGGGSRGGGAGAGAGAGGAEAAKPGVGPIVAAAAVSKLVASSITYPHEVIRSRLQFDRSGEMYSGMMDAVRKTYRHDGLAGFWQAAAAPTPSPAAAPAPLHWS